MQGLGMLQAACGGLRHQGNKLLERSVGKRSLFSFTPLPASDWFAPDGVTYCLPGVSDELQKQVIEIYAVPKQVVYSDTSLRSMSFGIMVFPF